MDYQVDEIAEVEHEREGSNGRTNDHDSPTDLLNRLLENGPSEERRKIARSMFARQANDVGHYDPS